jgi:hypothetical protein
LKLKIKKIFKKVLFKKKVNFSIFSQFFPNFFATDFFVQKIISQSQY